MTCYFIRPDAHTVGVGPRFSRRLDCHPMAIANNRESRSWRAVAISGVDADRPVPAEGDLS